MIRNRLKELMAERGLKASRVANDIENLSRNTINSTVNNNGKMIQFETVNSLCQYLGVTPADFFEYLPFDVDISISSDNELVTNYPEMEVLSASIAPFYLNLYLKKISTNQASGTTSKTFELSVILTNTVNFISVDSKFAPKNKADFVVVVGNPPQGNKDKEQVNEFKKFWNDNLTAGFQQDIRSRIISEISNYIQTEILNPIPSLKKFGGRVNFRFDENFNMKQELNDGPVIDFAGLDLPF
ncbi:helix-turn-helix domain-containing protein [Limosilactobacillus panis]|uniref:Helix-turn-helix transcriptional regulator n=1 Tax=Limosilactobacillus panis TaxID=47493 RepID=A0ABT7VP96_9LACO|nr:helix-turn-helix transcriptional regulator [Limosilactobacillus panis]MDM8334562.1 helix-turn-helix transcriptional regulator [Limosilactobacillus panis]